jgi:hypothetical protein
MSSNVDDRTIHEVGLHSTQALNRMTDEDNSTSSPSPKPLKETSALSCARTTKLGLPRHARAEVYFQGWVVSGMSQYLVFW